MIYHVQQTREPAVVEETAFLVCPESPQRRSSVTPVWRAVRLKIVDADFIGSLQIPTGLSVMLVCVATGAIRLSPKQFVAPFRRFGVKAAGWRPGSRKRELIKMEGRQFGGHQVRIAGDVAESILRRNGKLRRIIQARIKERSSDQAILCPHSIVVSCASSNSIGETSLTMTKHFRPEQIQAQASE